MAGFGGVTGRGAKQWGEGLQLTDISLSIRGMQGGTERNSLNWLFGASCTVFALSSCIWGGFSSVSGEVIEVCFSMYTDVDFPGS